MLKQIFPAFAMIAVMTLVTGILYPLGMTKFAGVVFPHQAAGSLIEKDGKVIGSALIGQNFTDAKYFQSRPSAITAPDPKDPSKTIDTPYDASNSAASNLAPSSKALIDRVTGDAAALKAQNSSQPVPVDLVTTSASGLDPDITPAAAAFQIPRVAKARNLPEDKLRQLVDAHTEGRLLGLIGEPHVNVLELNLALDKLAAGG